jgi:2-aminoadipate transaminase
MSTAWTSRYAQRTKGVKSSAIRELLKLTQRPEVISFAGGLPAPDVFPTERFEEACSGCFSQFRQGSLAVWRD